MKCPKCGTEQVRGEWVCRRCEYILDTSFLGGDILNERTRDGVDDDDGGEPEQPPADEPAEHTAIVTADDLGGDALILGRLDEGEVASFISDRTGGYLPVKLPAEKAVPSNVYVTDEVKPLLLLDGVLRHAADASGRRHVLSDFEAAIFDLIDGSRTLDDIQGIAGLSDNDLRVAVAMLHDKALIESTPRDAPHNTQIRPPRHTQSAAPLIIDDETAALHTPDLDAEAFDAPQPDDATRELELLPPLAEPSLVDRPLSTAASMDVFDELEMVPLPPAEPPPAEPSPAEPPPRATRSAEPAFAPPLAPKPALRPAARAAEVKAEPKKAASPAAGPSPSSSAPPASGASPKPSASADAARLRARGYHDLCMKDLEAGRVARAWGYAKMAADADPHEPRYQALLDNWHKERSADKPRTPQELMAAAQQAEAAGSFDEAIDLLRKLCQAATGSAAAYNKLAVLLATRARDFHGAYNAAIKAVELEPGNMAYQSNMMKILAKVDDESGGHRTNAADKGLLGRFLRR